MSTPLLAAKLVELRNQHGLSQLQVAECLGMSREGYSHYERSAREPSLEAVVRLSKLYGISVSELVNEKTVLTAEDMQQNKKASSKGSVIGIGAAMSVGMPSVLGAVAIPAARITANMEHFLKLFTGRNADIDVTEQKRILLFWNSTSVWTRRAGRKSASSLNSSIIQKKAKSDTAPQRMPHRSFLC